MIIEKLTELISDLKEKNMINMEEIDLIPSELTNGIVKSEDGKRVYIQMKSQYGINIEAHFDNLGINTLIAELRGIQPDLEQKEAVFEEGCTIEGIYIINGTNVATTEINNNLITFVITNPELKIGMMYHFNKVQAKEFHQSLTEQLEKIS